ncbi:MAG: anhydro-N-acetylmuramic acid kinase [Candidatus Limimorpha sp.]
MKKSNIIGLMSGSSLDGIDIIDADFWNDGAWNYKIIAKETIEYSDHWKRTLSDAFYLSKEQLEDLDIQYGRLLGRTISDFIRRNGLKPELIASHGHTVFHKPEERYTLQIGDGQAIADECGVTVINDFRTEDVLKGGQGAPLVPIGDKLLFHSYPICLNIGGIANVSYDIDNERIAYDICIANQALNYLANLSDDRLSYDKDGEIARSGKIDKNLLDKLNSLGYYYKNPPKSLGREYFEEDILPLFKMEALSVNDIMATFVEHIAIQIGESVNACDTATMIITGGGAKNSYLVERIKHNTKHQVFIPAIDIIDYKEALVFAFLGLLRKYGEINVLKSVTGASSDSSSGKIHYFSSSIRHSNG